MAKLRCACFLLVGVLSLGLLLALDYAVDASVRLVMNKLVAADLFGGDCLGENQHKPLALALRGSYSSSLDPTPSTSNILKDINGLRLQLDISPFYLDNEFNMTFSEMGVLGLGVEVYNNHIWVTKSSKRSTLSVRDPIYNINFITHLSPMTTDKMAHEVIDEQFIKLPTRFQNLSILERISQANQKARDIMQLYNYRPKEDALTDLYTFLSNDNYSLAMENDGSIVFVGEGNISSPRYDVPWSMPALSVKKSSYILPGLKTVALDFFRRERSVVAGIWADKYSLEDIWRSDLLCNLKSHTLLSLYELLQKYGILLESPQELKLKHIGIKWSRYMPFSAILDVYRPFGLPIGGTLATQINFHTDRRNTNVTDTRYKIPMFRASVTLESLPDWMMVWLIRFIHIRTAVVFLFMAYVFAFFTAAMIVLINRQFEKNEFLIRDIHHPL